ncbi:MAG: AAA family ATPase [Nitrospirota bacterium]
MNQINSNSTKIWDVKEPQAALKQVADLCEKEISLAIEIAADGNNFITKQSAAERKGILSIEGKIVENSHIAIEIEVVRCPSHFRASVVRFFSHLSKLGEKIDLLPPKSEVNGESSLWVVMKVAPSPMTLTRVSVFTNELKHIDETAGKLQSELPGIRKDTDIENVFKDVSEFLSPVLGLDGDLSGAFPELRSWALDIKDYLNGSAAVAIAAPDGISVSYALSVLCSLLRESGCYLGQLLMPSVSTKTLVELTRKTSIIPVIQAVSMSLGMNPYEMGNETRALLSALFYSGKPVIFTGSMVELQSVLAGGQGGANNPLCPVVSHVPDIDIERLVPFAVHSAARKAGGLPKKDISALVEETSAHIKIISAEKQLRVLPILANRTVRTWTQGKDAAVQPAGTFAEKAGELSETLSGLSPRPRVSRSREVQEQFVRVMGDYHKLYAYLNGHILAQDFALDRLTSHLLMESLTRPLHQPVRYCAQGTPATGKSESARLLAELLNIPYVNIDAASMPDYHTAASQLLGSGRGIVMSHQAGRLEQAAKHYSGALIEVSDLDHAVPSVRAALADLFLQVLETGEAQSATGAMFSCANVIFAFTMNLPDGLDEGMRKGIGFNNLPTRREIGRNVAKEIRTMLSGAFLSRVGTPIVFEPLDGPSLGMILERSIKNAALSAAERLNAKIAGVVLEAELGAKIITSMESSIVSFGARAVLEHGRMLVSRALAEAKHGCGSWEGKLIFIEAHEGKLIIKN